jgi:hypothetical protein
MAELDPPAVVKEAFPEAYSVVSARPCAPPWCTKSTSQGSTGSFSSRLRDPHVSLRPVVARRRCMPR